MFYLGHSFNLLLISLLGLNIENLDFAEVLTLGFSSLELLISFYEIVGGMGMESISIVVGIGCYGGRPAIESGEYLESTTQEKNLKINRAGSTPAPTTIADFRK